MVDDFLKNINIPIHDLRTYLFDYKKGFIGIFTKKNSSIV